MSRFAAIHKEYSQPNLQHDNSAYGQWIDEVPQSHRLAFPVDFESLSRTHNPGALDGLDLQDPEQRLFVVYRNLDGRTRVRRIEREAGEDLPRLSEAFLQGNLGGLPNHF
jgi:hypothetical protein